jgi:sugar lactone lactonase YvrE
MMLFMRRVVARASVFVFVLGLLAIARPAKSWDRGSVETFATLPAGATGPEGLTVAPDGKVYVTTFGFDATGAQPGPGQLYVYDPNGKLLRQVSVTPSSSHLLGLAFHPTTHMLLVIDFGAAKVLAVDPQSGTASVFMTAPTIVPPPGGPGLNALTFDSAGNVYVSDSFQGVIWRTGPTGGPAMQWVTDPLLLPNGIPPFGANGLAFNRAGNALFVANTANDSIVQIPVSGGMPGTPTALVYSINGADGLVLDASDNIWVAANQSDEIVVINPSGKSIAKLGDFDGIANDGSPRGFFFPASPAFSKDGKELLVTNLALDVTLAGVPSPTLQSQWAHQVKRYTISRIKAKIPPIQGN